MSLIAPPAPPPFPSVTPSNNPYEFITQVPATSKKGLLPGSGSKKTRILVVLVGLLLLAIIAAVVIGLISSGNKGPKDDYLNLLQQQTELIRISRVGMTKAQQAEAKNLAVTTNFSLTSEQPALAGLAKKAGAPTDAKTLAGGKNSQTDTLLTNAVQTNQFDSVFIKTMQTGLKKYQQTLKKIYDESTTKAAKDILAKDYANATVLIGTPVP